MSFLKRGNTYQSTSSEALNLHEKLPVGNYIVKMNLFGFYLEVIEHFEIKGKRYGDLDKNCERILNTFMTREVNTGAMFTGEKGSGKSLLAKAISIDAAKIHGIPTILVDTAFEDHNAFNTFIQSIGQPVVVLFDEFEKTYSSERQQLILTLLDGTMTSKKLFLFTCNDKWRVDEHMRNRPGRIFYMIDFSGLAREFIVEYCQDNIHEKKYIEKICDIATLFKEFNFDMLKAIVEEMNRYNESPEVVLRLLNAKPTHSSAEMKFKIEVYVKNKQVLSEKLDDIIWTGNPLTQEVNFYYTGTGNKSEYIHLESRHLQKIDAKTGVYVFIDDKDRHIKLIKEEASHSSWHDRLV